MNTYQNNELRVRRSRVTLTDIWIVKIDMNNHNIKLIIVVGMYVYIIF